MAKKFEVYLPEPILTNVFLRLGVKSLLRFKSVCKTWLSVISNPLFVESQLHLAIMNPTLLIIEYPRPRGNVVNALRESSSIKNFPRLVLPRRFEHCDVISCSYNGIVCLCDDNNVFYLWNPSIGEFKTLPPAPPRCWTRYDKIGFGYDSVSDDYEILMIVFENLSDVIPKVHLYSTNANSWRELQDPILKKLEGYDQTDIVVNGVLYFDNGDELISFDLHNEVLGRVPLPSFIERKMSNVLDFEGSVAFVFKSSGHAPGIDLWKLDDVSVQMQWVKCFRINAYCSRLRLCCYLGARVFYGVMSLDCSYFLHNILYDYETEETKIYGVRENITATLKYTQTLVSLSDFEPVESQLNHSHGRNRLEDHPLTRS